MVIDDHPLFRDGVASALGAFAGFDIVGNGSSADDALRLADQLRPDLLLMDINMPGDVLAAISSISERQPRARIAMLTVSEDESHVVQSMRAGASGYIVKGTSGPELARAVHDLVTGVQYVSPALAARILTRVPPVAVRSEPASYSQLTDRERQVIAHVAKGRTNKEIARELTLSDKTVKAHMTAIMQKLRVRNRMEVILKATSLSGGAPAEPDPGGNMGPATPGPAMPPRRMGRSGGSVQGTKGSR